MSSCISWTPVNDRILHVRFQHTAGHPSVIVAYASTENADRPVKEQFYAQLEAAIAEYGKNDLTVILGQVKSSQVAFT